MLAASLVAPCCAVLLLWNHSIYWPLVLMVLNANGVRGVGGFCGGGLRQALLIAVPSIVFVHSCTQEER